MKSRRQFAAWMAGICTMYRADLTDALIEIYWRALEDFTDDQLSAGLTRHVRDPERGRFFPNPADLIAAMTGTQTQQAGLALATVLESVRRIGRGPNVVFEDARIHAVLDQLGGWLATYNEVTYGDRSAFERRFLALYRVQIDTPTAAIHPVLRGADADITGKRPLPPRIVHVRAAPAAGGQLLLTEGTSQ